MEINDLPALITAILCMKKEKIYFMINKLCWKTKKSWWKQRTQLLWNLICIGTVCTDHSWDGNKLHLFFPSSLFLPISITKKNIFFKISILVLKVNSYSLILFNAEEAAWINRLHPVLKSQYALWHYILLSWKQLQWYSWFWCES